MANEEEAVQNYNPFGLESLKNWQLGNKGIMTHDGFFTDEYTMANPDYTKDMPDSEKFKTESRFDPTGVLNLGKFGLGIYDSLQNNKYQKMKMAQNWGALALQKAAYLTNLTQVQDQYADKLAKLGIAGTDTPAGGGGADTNAQRLQTREDLAAKRYGQGPTANV